MKTSRNPPNSASSGDLDQSKADGQLHELISRLYPDLSEVERAAAEANLVRYCEIALAVAEEELRYGATLTSTESVPTMKERSNVHLKT